MKLYQQGDVLMHQIATLPAKAQKKATTGRIILAAGEMTNHHHAVIEEEGVTLYTLDEILYLVADHEVSVTHEEHGVVTIPAGTYQIGIVQEYDYMAHEKRTVRD